jgi:DNA-binding NtrC family response regulator
VTVLASPDADLVGRQIVIETGLILGRSLETDVYPRLIINDSRVSRKHAVIRRLPASGGFELCDNQSRNGTLVDGVQSWNRALAPGALVRVGDTLLEIGPVPSGSVSGLDTSGAALIGRAASFVDVLRHAEQLAPTAMTVTLVGETGTGKEVVARWIHARSARGGPFVAVNCAAIPGELTESALFGHKKGSFTGAVGDSAGFFGEAEGGTLFLDEIGELPLGQQAKLLRVLENREFTPVGSTRIRTSGARVVAATNADLRAAVQAGRFRDDLLARLAGAMLTLPPLRARRSDIPLLIGHFLGELAPGIPLELEACALERLMLHPWPHNIRELRSLLVRLVQQRDQGGRILLGDVDAFLGPGRGALAAGSIEMPDRWSGERPASDELAALLRRYHGNVARLAAHYGKDTKQIYRWLKRYHLEPDEYR